MKHHVTTYQELLEACVYASGHLQSESTEEREYIINMLEDAIHNAKKGKNK